MRWKQIDKILQQALSQPPESLGSFLREACAGDDGLLREVESLLEHERHAGSLLTSPAGRSLAEAPAEPSDPDLLGRSLLHYRIVEKIGAGGMGVVYRAHDAHLNRSVALKVLPAGKMADPERRKRFIHEARAASALNHPNIVTIHDISTADGVDFIAMEYVAGKPLTQLIGDKGLPLRETLKIAVQIADALEKAHRAGIVHRDLKPSNIMVTGDGLVKVLDFGLAKLTQAGADDDLTKSAESLTQSGAIVGTAAYMSPEQAEGKPVDARSDIFAFGAVLYEMVTGRQAFKRDSSISTLSAILHEEPEPVSHIAYGIPQELERVIGRCLKKAPERRFQHMDDVKVALEELREEPATRKRPAAAYWIAGIVAVLAVGAGMWGILQFFPSHAGLPPPRFTPVTAYPGREEMPSLSPDGNWIAFKWNGEKQDNPDIYVMDLADRGEPTRLTTDPAIDGFPAWSPDSRLIGFLRFSGSRFALYVISPVGGEERKLAEYDGWYGLSWSPDGRNTAIVARESSKDPYSIWALSVKTLEKVRLTHPPAGIAGDLFPAYSPDGRYLAFTRAYQPARTALYVMRLPQGDPRLVTEENSPLIPCWTPDGRGLVYTSHPVSGELALWRVSVDGGKPQRIPTRGTGAQYASISHNRLAYDTCDYNFDIWRLELTGDAATTVPARALISSTSLDTCPHISPDGSKIAFGSLRSGTGEIWVCNSDGRNPLQLTHMTAGSPSWSPDGKRIAFDSTRDGSSDIYLVDAGGGLERRMTIDASEEVVPRWSRDGRWIYFGSNRSGDWQIWRMPSEGGEAIQITRNGGMEARESVDGQYLYYYPDVTPNRGVWRVPVSGGPETLVLSSVPWWGFWDLTARGIYFIDDSAKPVATLCFYDFATRQVRSLAPVHGEPGFKLDNGFSVSPDGKWLLYSGGIFTADIMLIDNFR